MFIVNERRGRLDSETTSQALRLIGALQVTLDSDPEEGSLMRLARTHRLTAYDAAYLELAQRRGLPLATLDSALARAARTEAVALVGGGV